MRTRVEKERRGSQCQPGKLVFIVERCGAFHIIRGDFFRRKCALGSESIRGFSSRCTPAFLKCMRRPRTFPSRPFLPERGARRQGFPGSFLRNKEEVFSVFPRDRQPSQINSLSGGIIFPKWPFINERPPRSLLKNGDRQSDANFPTDGTPRRVRR